MKRHLCVSFIVFCAGCAQPMQIDPSQVGDAKAQLNIESPDLAGYVSVPLINSKVVNVRLSKFSGCTAEKTAEEDQKPIGKATLTPKINSQTVAIPADTQLVIYGESLEMTGGNSFSCGRAVRFTSEPGKTYVLKFKPHKSWGVGLCEMELVTSTDAGESPVSSAHYAIVEYKGFFKGDQLELCK